MKDQNLTIYKGKTLQEVKKIAQEMRVRVVQEDDQAFVITCDLRKDRINLNIQNGVVVEAWIG